MYDHNPFSFPGMSKPPAGMTELFRTYMLANEGMAQSETLYGYSKAELMMGAVQQQNEYLNAQMNAIVLGPEKCVHCGKVRRLQGEREVWKWMPSGDRHMAKGKACVDCYVRNRSRFWHVLYGLGLV